MRPKLGLFNMMQGRDPPGKRSDRSAKFASFVMSNSAFCDIMQGENQRLYAVIDCLLCLYVITELDLYDIMQVESQRLYVVIDRLNLRSL